VTVVALDLPTSHQLLAPSKADAFTGRVLAAINDMLLDMLAAVARKDYEDRKRRTAEGREKPKLTACIKDAPSIKRNIVASMNYWPKASPSARLPTS